MTACIVDPFAGPGGWSEGLAMLGLRDVGIELDRSACATRAAAGHLTIRADVASYPAERFAGYDGLILSPPCQAFSAAGKGHGRDVIPQLVKAISKGDWSARPDPDPKVWLVLEVGRWVQAIMPRWIACEQVPAVLPLWRAYARLFSQWGYRTWVGKLHSEQFGVPQTRTRAILMCSRDRFSAPVPTHQRWVNGQPAQAGASLFGEVLPWVSMAEALGRGMTERPSVSVTTMTAGGSGARRTVRAERSAERWALRNGNQAHAAVRPITAPAPTIMASADNGDTRWLQPSPTLAQAEKWVLTRPATTIACDPRLSPPGHHDPNSPNSQHGEGTVSLTIPEGAVLQGFRADYPWQGTKSKRWEQVGNAIPPPMAAAILKELL